MASLPVHNLSDGKFRLDGGAMFGIVPRVLWQRSDPPDEQNRILLGLNCLLVEGPGYRVIVDTGVGDKEGDEFADMFALEREENLFHALARRGLSPTDITHVVNTHLHFDHCGGNTRLDDGGKAVPSFPRARYLVQRGEWEDALAANERTRASYLERNYLPLKEAGLLELVDGETEILPGLKLIPTPGHTPHHQSLLLAAGGEQVLFAGDLIPTSSHLPLPYIMAYDLFPLETLETKRRILRRQRDEGWLIFFVHEPGEQPLGRLEWVRTQKGERPVFRPLPLDSHED